MTEIALTVSERRRSLVGVISSMAVTALIYGLTVPLLALVLNAQGVDSAMIGLNTAAQSLAVIAVAPFAPRWIGALGPARSMIIGIGVSLVVFLLLPVFPNVYAWFPLRFIIGAAGALQWIAGEVWVNQIAGERTRGRVVGLYGAALSGGFALGPFVLAQTGSVGWTPFLVSATIFAISATPLLLTARAAPRFEGLPSVRLPKYLLLVPVAMFLNLIFAASDGALLTFLPIYGLHLGLEESASLYLITLMGIGGMVFQLPVGWLADHMDRRLLVICCVLAVMASIAAMPFIIDVIPWNWPYAFVFGGALGVLYSLGVTLLGERFRGADLAAATSVFTVMWGVGSIVGPPAGGAGMALLGPHGLPVAVGLMFLLYLPIPLVSFLRRRS